MLLDLLIDKADCGRPTLHLQRVIAGLGLIVGSLRLKKWPTTALFVTDAKLGTNDLRDKRVKFTKETICISALKYLISINYVNEYN